MSEAFDNVGVMMLLHQKMMRDAEVVTAKWRHVARNLIGATWRAPLHSSGFQ